MYIQDYTFVVADRILSLEKGDKFCQGVFMPYGITYDDDNYVKEERNGGFGSTGR